MPEIIFQPDDKTFPAETGESILQVAEREGIPLAHACGGQARCSTCRVRVVEGLEHCRPRTEAEQVLAGQFRFDPATRLACQTTFSAPVLVRRLVLDDDDLATSSLLKIGPGPHAIGRERQVGILFADLRGFTAFAEKLLPYDVIHILDRWVHHMSRAISRHGGEIDNLMGDGLMALFMADKPADAALAAVRAGLDMQMELERLNTYLKHGGRKTLRMGVGVHVGCVVVGTIGPVGVRRTTAIGDAVNLASRVESATKTTAANLLISQDTYELVRERLQARASCPLELAGKTGKHTLYEVTGVV